MRNASLTIVCKMLSSFTLCLCLTIVSVAQSDPQSNPPAGQDDVTRQLLQRLLEMEAELNQLKAHSAVPAQAAIAAPAPVLAPAPAPASAPPTADPSQTHDAYYPGRVNGAAMGARNGFDADGTFKLRYDPVSGAMCLLPTR
jgi:hypothetical protein